MTLEESVSAGLFGITLALAFSNPWLVAVAVVGADLLVTIRKGNK